MTKTDEKVQKKLKVPLEEENVRRVDSRYGYVKRAVHVLTHSAPALERAFQCLARNIYRTNLSQDKKIVNRLFNNSATHIHYIMIKNTTSLIPKIQLTYL